MEKQILIPIILVLGILTLGGVIAGIYLYRNKFMKKGVDVEGNLCDNNENVVDDEVNKQENTTDLIKKAIEINDRIGVNQRKMFDEQIAASDRKIAGFERLEQGCDDFIEQCNVTKAGMDQTRQTIGELKSINGFQMAYYEAAAKNAERNLDNLNTRT